MSKELQKKQSYLTRTAQKSDEIKDLRSKLEDSLNIVARDTVYEPKVLDRESQKLEDSLVDGSYSSPSRGTKSGSPPLRITSTPASPLRRTVGGSRRLTPGISPLRKTRKSAS